VLHGERGAFGDVGTCREEQERWNEDAKPHRRVEYHKHPRLENSAREALG
jgi:hypothetical protein